MSENKKTTILSNPDDVIESFGGLRPMSTKTEIPVSTIQGWKKRGSIPQNRYPEIIKAAETHNVILPQDDAKTATQTSQSAKANDNNGQTQPQPSPENKTQAVSPAPAATQQKTTEDSAAAVNTRPAPSSSKTGESSMSNPSQKSQASQSETDSDYKLSLAKAENRAVTKSTWISIIIITLIGILAAILLWPQAEGLKNQVDQNSENISTLQGSVQSLEEQQAQGQQEQRSMFETFVPEDWQNQINDLRSQAEDWQNQAANVQKQLGSAIERAETISGDVMGENAGNMEQRLTKLEAHMRELMGDPDLNQMFTRLQSFQASLPGQEILGSTENQLSALLSQFDGAPDQLNQYLDAARQESNAMGQTFEGVPQEDMKAAALLFGLNQFRGALNRDNQPFDEDLEILRNLVGQDNPALNDAISRMAPHAQSGVLTVEGLSQEFRGVAGEAVVASLKGEDISIQERAKARMNELFSVEQNGELVTGTETQAKVARTMQFLEADQLDKAIAEAQTLDGDAGAAIAPWLGQAQATMDAQQIKTLIDSTISKETLGNLKRGIVPGGAGQGQLIRDDESGMTVYTPARRLRTQPSNGGLQ